MICLNLKRSKSRNRGYADNSVEECNVVYDIWRNAIIYKGYE